MNNLNQQSILITGGKGQLATELKILLPNAIYVDIDELDITNEVAVNEFVTTKNIECIVNCAAYTAVDRAEEEEDLAYKVNALGPKNLAKTNCKLIHVSTDYVFDGNNCTPYKPSDFTKPLSAYGRTKLEGENAVLECSDNVVIIRTAWLYSSYGNNFVKTMIRLGNEREEVRVVNDQVGTPTYAADLAKAIIQILPQLKPSVKGVYHFTNEGVCSWYDFAYAIMKEMKIDCIVTPVCSAEFPTTAHRPNYSVLDKNLIKNTFNINIPHWTESLKKCLKQF
jgi:dTDP-4-dehydrorhamnose reductase